MLRSDSPSSGAAGGKARLMSALFGRRQSSAPSLGVKNGALRDDCESDSGRSVGDGERDDESSTVASPRKNKRSWTRLQFKSSREKSREQLAQKIDSLKEQAGSDDEAKQ